MSGGAETIRRAIWKFVSEQNEAAQSQSFFAFLSNRDDLLAEAVAAARTAPPARTYAEGVSASEMVARWQQEHLAYPGSHWGDAVAWNSAYVIAAKLDESAATSRSQHEGAE